MNEQDIKILEEGVNRSIKQGNLEMLKIWCRFLLSGVRLYESKLHKQNFLGIPEKDFKELFRD